MPPVRRFFVDVETAVRGDKLSYPDDVASFAGTMATLLGRLSTPVSASAASPIRVTEVLHKFKDYFTFSEQQDAHELLLLLMNTVTDNEWTPAVTAAQVDSMAGPTALTRLAYNARALHARRLRWLARPDCSVAGTASLPVSPGSASSKSLLSVGSVSSAGSLASSASMAGSGAGSGSGSGAGSAAASPVALATTPAGGSPCHPCPDADSAAGKPLHAVVPPEVPCAVPVATAAAAAAAAANTNTTRPPRLAAPSRPPRPYAARWRLEQLRSSLASKASMFRNTLLTTSSTYHNPLEGLAAQCFKCPECGFKCVGVVLGLATTIDCVTDAWCLVVGCWLFLRRTPWQNESFLTLSLNISQHSRTIHRCLQTYRQVEFVEGYRCAKSVPLLEFFWGAVDVSVLLSSPVFLCSSLHQVQS